MPKRGHINDSEGSNAPRPVGGDISGMIYYTGNHLNHALDASQNLGSGTQKKIITLIFRAQSSKDEGTGESRKVKSRL
jgi:hypothetical protein